MDNKTPLQPIKVKNIEKASEDDFQKYLQAREEIDNTLRNTDKPSEIPSWIHEKSSQSNDDIEKTFSENELKREIQIEPEKIKTYRTYIVLQLGSDVIKHCVASFENDVYDGGRVQKPSYRLMPIHSDVVFQLPKSLAIPETTNGVKNIIFPNPFYVEIMEGTDNLISSICLGSQAESYKTDLEEDRKSYDYSSKMYPHRVRVNIDKNNYLVFQYYQSKHCLEFLSGNIELEKSLDGTNFSKTQETYIKSSQEKKNKIMV